MGRLRDAGDVHVGRRSLHSQTFEIRIAQPRPAKATVTGPRMTTTTRAQYAPVDAAKNGGQALWSEIFGERKTTACAESGRGERCEG